MKNINLLYISLSGNTESFVNKLYDNIKNDYVVTLISAKELHKNNEPLILETDTFVFVPTYLDGGNGVDNGVTEVLTTPLKDLLLTNGNSKYVKGIVGFGNKNFNNQYCLTAKRYSDLFNAPFFADVELRGTLKDIENVSNGIKSILEND